MALWNDLILRSPQSGRLEGRKGFLQPNRDTTEISVVTQFGIGRRLARAWPGHPREADLSLPLVGGRAKPGQDGSNGDNTGKVSHYRNFYNLDKCNVIRYTSRS
jgi:hypothetical protein